MSSESARLQKITQIISDQNEPSYRLSQVLHAVYQSKTLDFDQISNIPKPLKEALTKEFGTMLSIRPLREAAGKSVKKVLFETKDGDKIESVWMNYTPEFSLARESLCVSSQSGCAMGCKFCYTGTMGFMKNLTVDEICDQVLYFKKTQDFNGSVSFMGMGEPFANPDYVFTAFKLLTDPKLFNIGQRKINVSTVGIVPGIERLSKEFPEINLAYSLHTPFDEQRIQLMPVTKAYPISTVMTALDDHIRRNKRKIFLAYILIKGVNDTKEHAHALVKLIKQRRDAAYLYHVNLIKFHGTEEEMGFSQPDKDAVDAFIKILETGKINASLRMSLGLDIDAACGQLCARA